MFWVIPQTLSNFYSSLFIQQILIEKLIACQSQLNARDYGRKEDKQGPREFLELLVGRGTGLP